MNATVMITTPNKRTSATITAWALILMAILGGFALGYAFPIFYTPEQVDHLKDNMLTNWGLYQQMILGIFLTLILDLVVSYSIYAYFKDDNRSIASASGILRLVYTLIFGIATYFLIRNMTNDLLTNQSVNENLRLFETIWFIGLVIFGMHIILTGYLMKLHRKIPKILWLITVLAGFSYMIIHLFSLMGLNADLLNIMEMVLALPMIVGELGLAIWLLVRGGK